MQQSEAAGQIPDYDAGLLNDFGGGNVDWWLDYLRAEIGNANDHWRQQVSALTASTLHSGTVGVPVVTWPAVNAACTVFAEKMGYVPFDEFLFDSQQRWLSGMRPALEAAIAASPPTPVVDAAREGEPVGCETCNDTGKEGRHSICRDCDDLPASPPSEPAPQVVGDWRPMSEAPKDGKHVILAVQRDCFVYAIQGAFMQGKWLNAADIEAEPLCWMPNVNIPDEYLPWVKAATLSTDADGKEG